MATNLDNLEMQSPGSFEEPSAHKAITSVPAKQQFVVVYLHGLTMDLHECDAVAAECDKVFGNLVINIQAKCREGLKSAYYPLNEQARKVVEEIKATLFDRFAFVKEQIKTVPIHLFGYSQGGLVACVIAANYKDELNIRTIITAHSPLSGTDVLENTKSDVNEFYAKAKPGLKAIGHPNTSLLEARVSGMLLNNIFWKPFANLIARGIRDMRTNSPCIENIKAFIRDGKHNIPILLIAGYLSNLGEYFDFAEEDKEKVDAFIKAYTSLTTRQKDGEHDLLIPVKRQLCRCDSFESLASSKDDPVYPSHVKTYVADRTIHCYNLVPILSDFQVHHGKTLFECPETRTVITDFIASNLN